ncbi:hypothetical protein ACWD4J_19210 [Streptomyces sp. NPDC002577]
MNATGPQTRARTAETTRRRAVASEETQHPPNGHSWRDFSITLPVGQAASAVVKTATMPVRTAQRVLPAMGGLPLYLGLGTLGVVGVLEWPVAAGIGVGYAVLRRGGTLAPASAARSTGSDAESRTGSGKIATE